MLYHQIHLNLHAGMADLVHRRDTEGLLVAMDLTEVAMGQYPEQVKDIQLVISVNLLENGTLEEEEVTIVEMLEELLIIQKEPVEQREVITQEQYAGVMVEVDTEVGPEERKEPGGLAGIVPLGATALSLSVTMPMSNNLYL